VEVILQFIVLILILIGTLFSVVGVIGFLRLPDVYTRLHATGKVSVFGVVLLLLAAVFWTPVGIGKDLVLIGLLMLAGPVATHTIASAAYRLGIPMRMAVRNDLKDVEPQPEMEMEE
jgi:multicomponent Na+:H+ antiporter subunit G